MPGSFLPVYDLIDDGSLLGRGFAEINAGGFDTFVSHKVGEESDVIAAFQEALCETVTEGVWVNNHRVDTIFKQVRSERTAYLRRVSNTLPPMHMDSQRQKKNRMAVH